MPNLRVYSGNRLEDLADRLAAVLARPLSSPLAQETVVVPGHGVGRWLSLRLAERFGVWANFRLLAPDQFLSAAVKAVVPDAPDPQPYGLEALTWRIWKHLPALAAAPEIRGYLAEDPGGTKGFQLAKRLAGTFELYGAFRPDLLEAWERGEEEGWQPDLWRALAAEAPGAHKAAQLTELLRRLPSAAPAPGALPERVAVFGFATLAPRRLEALKALCSHVEVNLFALSPCREYWGDVVPPREEARRRARALARGASPDDLHLERGNRLLASLGREGRDFLVGVLELDDDAADCFRDPGEGTLLACLQSDVLNLRDRGADGEGKTLLAPDDRSLEVHSCHGPVRELEVLHDRLLDLFDTLGGLTPADVVVLTPDVEAYAPAIESVFDGVVDASRRIPFAVAGRGARSEGRLADALLRLLDLHGGRFGAGAVLDFLELPLVRARFGLSAADLETVQSWVEAVRIRWGVDGEARSRLGLPSFEDGTWRAGLRRLLLGYALPGDDRRLFEGTLPFDDVEGSGARVLGAFADFAETLFAAVEDLGTPRPLGSWAALLDNLAERFLAVEEAGEHELRTLRGELSLLADAERLAGVDAPADVRVVRRHLRERLEEAAGGGGLFTGRVTFCSLRALRGVPFRVVALLGMNDGAFPRADRPPSFDRIAASPRRGDPSLRDEDRALFLQAMLSARERLYVSYVGQSVADNSASPPSVLVSELLDAVSQGFRAEEGDLLERLVVHERLQAFSPANFSPGGPLFSYSRENFEGARARNGPPPAPAPFLAAPLPEPPEEWRTVDVADLAAFFSHPSRFFLQRRLGVRLEADEYGVDEREAFAVDGLDRYLVVEELTLRALDGEDPEGEKELLRARGVLPPGGPGETAFDRLRTEALDLSARVRSLVRGGPLEPLEMNLDFGDFRLCGRLDQLWPAAQVRFRPAKVRPGDRLRLWVEHLALCCARRPGYPEESLFLGQKDEVRFRRADDCRDLLGRLLALYWEGLRRPLPLLPSCSCEYEKKRAESREDALDAARKEWRGTGYEQAPPGEGQDPYNALCFREGFRFRGEFEDLAAEVFAPLLAHRGKP